jgi:uncharacterized membrane protein YphA (DoxX/SURF4 family)
MLHQIAVSLVGVFFALSGYHKLTNTARGQSMLATLQAQHIPYPGVMRWWVSGWEFAGGIMVAVGSMAGFGHTYTVKLCVLALMCICFIATCTDGLSRIKAWEPLDKADWLDDLLYLPEFWLQVILLQALFA